LMHGAVDKTTYLICKITAIDLVQGLPDAKEIYRKNGFVVFVRPKS